MPELAVPDPGYDERLGVPLRWWVQGVMLLATFWQFADDLAASLKKGDAILMHCGAGIGRTGTMATAVLMALGTAREAALRAVQAAGSHPETPSQRLLLSSQHGR